MCTVLLPLVVNPTAVNKYMRVVPKVSVLIFYLNVYWTHLKIQVISFKV